MLLSKVSGMLCSKLTRRFPVWRITARRRAGNRMHVIGASVWRAHKFDGSPLLS
jgi:hypothetical protein